MAQVSKTYRYAIFDVNGNYLTDWVDVVSDPSFRWEINNGLAELVVKLARPFNSFGEGSDVWFENQVQLYAFDKEAPSGTLIYSGRLNEYRPHFGADIKSEYVEVQFLGYVTQLADRFIHDKTAVDFTLSNSQAQTLSLPYNDSNQNANTSIVQFFTPTIPNITGIKLPLASTLATHPALTVGIMYLDAVPNTGETAFTIPQHYFVAPDLQNLKPGVVLASGVVPANSLSQTLTPTTVNFPNTVYNLQIAGFSNQATRWYGIFIAGSGVQTQYVSLAGSIFNPPPAIYRAWGAQGGADNRTGYITMGDIENLQITTLYDSTAPTYNSQDPTTIVADIINNKFAGQITFDSLNSQATGLSVSYQFNKQDIKAAIDTLTALAPPYWFWRVGPDNKLVFKRRDDVTIDHFLRLGFEILEAAPVKSVNDIKTRVMFYGGAGIGTAELIYIDDRTGMQPAYTIKEKLLRDGRVTVQASAQLLARDYLDYYGTPNLVMTITVADSNGDYQYGYDIESFIPGQRVQILDPQADNYKTVAGSWDNFNWDGDVWDGSEYNLLSTPFQIMRIDYQPDKAVLTLATQVDTSSRTIQADQANLQQNVTSNAPTS